MDAKAAQVQAQFAEQTDGQLTQGSAAQIHALANAPVTLPASPALPASGVSTARAETYSATQYTPSAQEAATGAYSAQKQQPATQPAQQPSAAATQPLTTPAPATTEPGKKSKHKATRTETVPTLVTAPGEQNPSQVTAPELGVRPESFPHYERNHGRGTAAAQPASAARAMGDGAARGARGDPARRSRDAVADSGERLQRLDGRGGPG